MYINVAEKYNNSEKHNASSKKVFDYKKNNFHRLNSLISSIDWISLCCCNNVTELESAVKKIL